MPCSHPSRLAEDGEHLRMTFPVLTSLHEEIVPALPHSFGKSLRNAISAASPGDSTGRSNTGCGSVTMS
jgi:hypothetical protein